MSPISGCTCMPIPTWDFAAGVASRTEQIIQEGKVM